MITEASTKGLGSTHKSDIRYGAQCGGDNNDKCTLAWPTLFLPPFLLADNRICQFVKMEGNTHVQAYEYTGIQI